MTNHRYIFGLLCLGLSLCLAACNETVSLDTRNAPKIFFQDPPHEGEYVFPEALFVAELTIIEGCVQLTLDGSPEAAIIPIWPDYVRLVETSKGYHIDVKGKQLRFGKTYNFGGAGDKLSANSNMTRECHSKSAWGVGDVHK